MTGLVSREEGGERVADWDIQYPPLHARDTTLVQESALGSSLRSLLRSFCDTITGESFPICYSTACKNKKNKKPEKQQGCGDDSETVALAEDPGSSPAPTQRLTASSNSSPGGSDVIF